MLQTKRNYYSLLEITSLRCIYMKRFLVILITGLFANSIVASSDAETSDSRTSSPRATLEVVKETPLYRLERGIPKERTPLESFFKRMRQIQGNENKQLTFNDVVYCIEKRSENSWSIKKHRVLNNGNIDKSTYENDLLLLFNALKKAAHDGSSELEIKNSSETNLNRDEHFNPANERSLTSVSCTPRSSALPPVTYTPRSEHNTSRLSIASVLAVAPLHPDAE